jgi:hypothetical protein
MRRRSRRGQASVDGRCRQCRERLRGRHVGQSAQRGSRRHHPTDPARRDRRVRGRGRSTEGDRTRDRRGRSR